MKVNKSKIKTSLTQEDLQAIGDLMGGLLDKQSAVLASKKDLQEVKDDLQAVKNDLETNVATKQDLSDLKEYIHEGFEAVMDGMDAIAEKLADKEKFDLMVEWAREVGEKVGVNPRV